MYCPSLTPAGVDRTPSQAAPRLLGPADELVPGDQGARVLGAQDPLADGQQVGELVAGPGRIPRLPNPAGEVVASD